MHQLYGYQRYGCILLFFLFSSVTAAIGQGFSEHLWLFGDNGKAIVFNKGNNNATAVPGYNLPFEGRGGTAVATDPISGELLFYADGISVRDATHNPMSGQVALSGNPNINQSAAIAAIVDVPGQYLLFSNGGENGIYVTTVDMNLPGNANPGSPPKGEIVGAPNNNVVAAASAEAMRVVPNANLDGYWLIHHNLATGQLEVRGIDAAGVITEVSSVALGAGFNAAHIAYNAATGMLAVSPKGANRNIRLYDFNDVTGAISLDREIEGTSNTDDTGQSVYSTAFSEDGSYLYFSRFGREGENRGNVYQMSLEPDPDEVRNILPAAVYRSYGLQRGPDNKIYHIYEANEGEGLQMGSINEPDSLAENIEYELQAFENNGFGAWQFPQFVQTPTDECDVDFEVYNTCANSPSLLVPRVSPEASSYEWTIQDTTITAKSPIFVFPEEGLYNITLAVFCGGDTLRTSQSIQIQPSDMQIDIPQDTTICPGETLELDATTEGATAYRWSVRDNDGNPITTPAITVDSAGYYWVVATDPMGCDVYAGSNVKIYGEEDRRSNIWYFGDGAGIDFNEQPPEPIVDDNLLRAPEGTATISDRNGDALFYTDGVTVWNSDHMPLPLSDDLIAAGAAPEDGLGGSLGSTQSSIIIPFPDDETLFYIFTTEEIHGEYFMRYSVVDLKGNNGFGEIILVGEPLFSKSTERLTAVEIGAGYVLLGHEYGTNTFRAYQIGAGGIENPVLSSIGSVHSTNIQQNGEGYMKFSTNGERVGVALPPDAVEIFNFNDSTLEMSDVIRLDMEAGETPYGLEFSPDGTRLYVSVNNNGSAPSKLYQYNLDTIPEDIINTKILIDESSSETWGALQISPNGSIYMAVQGAGFLWEIGNPNEDAAEENIVLNEFDLAGRTSQLGLPNFIQTIMEPPGDPGITVINGCIGQETVFEGTGTDNIDEFFWQIFDGFGDDKVLLHSDSEQNTAFTFEEAGEYLAELRVFNRCGFDTLIYDTVQVFDIPEYPELEEFTALCGDEAILEAAPEDDSAGLTYLWSTGETTRTISVNLQGDYFVTVTNETGCSNEGQTFVYDGRPAIDLGPDLALCEGDDGPILDAENTGAQFVWEINGEVQDNNRRDFEVRTNVPGEYLYKVSVTDPISGCIGVDSVNVSIAANPIIALTKTDNATCGADNGTLTITFPQVGEYEYVVEGSEGGAPAATGFEDVNTPNQEVTIDGLGSDLYRVVITNTNGCSTSEQIDINDEDAGFTIEADDITVCEDGEVEIIIAGLGDEIPPGSEANYTFINEATGEQITGVFDAPRFDTNDPIPVGIYRIRIEIGGCVQSTGLVEVEKAPAVAFSTERFVEACGDTQELTVETDDLLNLTYSWATEDGNITAGGGGRTVTVSQSGNYTVTVADGRGILCDSTATISVTFDEGFELSIVQEGVLCNDDVSLFSVVSEPGNYSYRWEKVGDETFEPRITNNITPTEGGTYELTARNQRTGCIASTSVFVEEQDPDEPILPESAIICTAAPELAGVELDPGAYASYEWTGPGTSQSTDKIFYATIPGRYRVNLTTAEGCELVARVDVIESCEPSIQGPSAFSPNGDGLNDNFRLIVRFVTDFQIFIFNRWGEMVFQSTDPNFEWDGIFRGELVQIGTYPYRITYRSEFEPDEERREKRGGVTVVR